MEFLETNNASMKTYLDSINYVHQGGNIPICDEEFCVGIQTCYDVFTFLLDSSGKLVSDQHLLYYGSTLRVGEHLGEDENVLETNYHVTSPDGAIIGPFEHETHGAYHSFESKRTHVHLGKLSRNVETIVFCIVKNHDRDWWPPAGRLLHARLFKDTDWLYGGSLGETIACTDFCDGYGCLVNLDGPISQIKEHKDRLFGENLFAKNDMYAFFAAEILSIVRTDTSWSLNSIGRPYRTFEEILKKYI